MRSEDTRNQQAFAVSRSVISRAVLLPFIVMFVVVTGSGCRLCCDRDDIAYSAYGGVWQRTQRDSGRVGSLFDAGGAMVANLDERESPDGLDERSEMTPRDDRPEEALDGQESNEPPTKSEEENNEEFQEKLRKFHENQMQNASIIPGTPLPPDLH